MSRQYSEGARAPEAPEMIRRARSRPRVLAGGSAPWARLSGEHAQGLQDDDVDGLALLDGGVAGDDRESIREHHRSQDGGALLPRQAGGVVVALGGERDAQVASAESRVGDRLGSLRGDARP